MARTRFVAQRTTYNTNGTVKAVELRHGEYTDALTCDEEEELFMALSPQLKLSGTSLTVPVANAGKKWQLRSCSTDSRPFCTRGPSITSIMVNSPSSIRVMYDGQDLTSINWKIRKNGIQLHFGNSGLLTTNTFDISLPEPLELGVYTLNLDGTTCQPTNLAAAQQTFTIGTVNTSLTQQLIAGAGDVFSPTVEWSNGKARISNVKTPNVPDGHTLYYWICGGTPTTSLPTAYTLSTGDEIGIMAAIIPNSSTINSGANWLKKDWSNIIIGPAPTN